MQPQRDYERFIAWLGLSPRLRGTTVRTYALNLHSYWMGQGVNLLSRAAMVMMARIVKEKAPPAERLTHDTHRDGLTAHQVATLCGDATISRMGRAAIAILFATGDRPSAIIPTTGDNTSALKWKDVTWCLDGMIELTHRIGKNTRCYGEMKRVVAASGGAHDPIMWFRYLERQGAHAADDFIFDEHVRAEISARIKALSGGGKQYTIYSLRIGCTTALTAAGLPAAMIQLIMGWRSASSYGKYLRIDERFATAAARCLSVHN